MGFLKLSEIEVAKVVGELERARSEDYDRTTIVHCVKSIQPTLQKCHHGRAWLQQLEKLLLSGNGDRAIRVFRDGIARQFRWYVYPAFFFCLPLLVVLIAWLVYG